jgi:hypothetical protein
MNRYAVSGTCGDVLELRATEMPADANAAPLLIQIKRLFSHSE